MSGDVDWMREELADAFEFDGAWDGACERGVATYIARDKHVLARDRTFDKIDQPAEIPPRTEFICAIRTRVSRQQGLDTHRSHTVRHRGTIRVAALELETNGIEVIPERGAIEVDSLEWEIMSILWKPEGWAKPVFAEIELVRDAGR